MNKLETRKDFIEAYFDEWCNKSRRLGQLVENGMSEEAMTLACCYIAALANGRYGHTKRERDSFVKVVLEYSRFAPLLSRVSTLYLRRLGHDREAKQPNGKPVHGFNSVVAILDNDMCVDDAMVRVRESLNKVDFDQISADIMRFTYAAILYEEFRNQGVHHGGMGHIRSVETQQHVFPESDDGSPVYYENGRLEFAGFFVLELLDQVIDGLRRECLERNVFLGRTE